MLIWVDPELSLLDKTLAQAQILVPVLRVLRSKFGREKVDAIVREALRGWSRQFFAAIGGGIECSPRRKWATLQAAGLKSASPTSRRRYAAMTRQRSTSR